MKILAEYFKEIEKLFDWYFHLTQIKRIQLNHIVILVLLVYLAYKNDEQHRENYNILSLRIDSVNNARAKEQREYTENLKFFTEEFSDLSKDLLQQRERVQQIKDKQ